MEQPTAVLPSAKVVPDRGVQSVARMPQQRSLAVASNESVAPAGLVHSTTCGAGHVSAGAVVSAAGSCRGAVGTVVAK